MNTYTLEKVRQKAGGRRQKERIGPSGVGLHCQIQGQGGRQGAVCLL
ncbi:hypothetical protein [Okeania sp. SIO3B5]|nr:hypothetical protein [Okeania sp. SIO3B5]